MSKPVIILDPSWRQLSELFSDPDLRRLHDTYDIVWGKDEPMPPELFAAALPTANFIISAVPRLDTLALERAGRLRAIFEVAGAFPDSIDYHTCFGRGIDVLCCAPGFRASVAEMGLTMALSGARGLVSEHEAFRAGGEHWLSDNTATDFTLYGAKIGFLGFGSIAREIARLCLPFQPEFLAYDPWVNHEVALESGVRLVSFDQLIRSGRLLFVTAAPTVENRGILGRDAIAALPDGTLVVLISRAHLVDFDALCLAASSGRIRAAIDVFPEEPLRHDHAVRQNPNVILSPHRAAAVQGGRQLIGRMIVEDLGRIVAGGQPVDLQRATPDRVGLLAGVQSSKRIEEMAAKR
ncbi:hydroxyacid dehydrogenase [Ensifer adhaerens]|uniref:NAD(P)-dependent oxidoreductase n=1 Tax=Ensifer adhaerens TaxID=106592 RepID=UPI001CC1A185|nr:NAD(P)-dependent oxidoreductase [Ensifer adhaerens]MBZ7924375.1 hydroxyacid dehydrogenase [Ensifer adhaerens]UAX96378.1 hydroxyacid dehydrogenase [Ensifer adhaerens]UAY04279.1 hydroxyacid dehydrogenase [Ensifer adhaerens]UAY12265.1 hydroxyacid dehydrogenase [Ensifer adhaerens]